MLSVLKPGSTPRLLWFAIVALMCVRASAELCGDGSRPRFRIEMDPGLGQTPVSGRLLLMMTQQFRPKSRLSPRLGKSARSVWVTAEEVRDLTPHRPVYLDTNVAGFPSRWCEAPGGEYSIRAVLDVNHVFAYLYDVSEGDLSSATLKQEFDPASNRTLNLTLTERAPSRALKTLPGTEWIDFKSPVLSSYWGRPIHIRGVVVLPSSYARGRGHYPTVYMTHAFGMDLSALSEGSAAEIKDLMDAGKIPEMIWVLLSEQVPSGTHEFADSVNNGPWEKAFITELVPYLEGRYRMDGKPSGRFLTGHSSGGWAALWSLVNNPDFFGGAWATAPDPTDFRSFMGLDLASSPLPNFYRQENGSPRMYIRMGGEDTESLEDLARLEQIVGDYGGQIGSFEWVFSPRGPNGRPMPLFDRESGVIDPLVASHWIRHYDIAALLRRNWSKIGRSLDGKIHVTVGTSDTFHLDEPARLLEQTIKDLGGRASFTYLEGRTHFDLYRGGLYEEIAKEMYEHARPKARAK